MLLGQLAARWWGMFHYLLHTAAATGVAGGDAAAVWGWMLVEGWHMGSICSDCYVKGAAQATCGCALLQLLFGACRHPWYTTACRVLQAGSTMNCQAL